MTYTPDTRIAGPSRGSADAWFEWAKAKGAARLPDVRLYLDTVYEFAPEAGLRAELIVTQSIHETSESGVPWVSYWWRERCNPAGIGITGDPNQNNASKNFPNGRSAAFAQMVHMALYVFGSLPAALAPYRREDPRADAIPRDALGRRTTTGSFGSDGSVITWAVDPDYGSKWAGWANRLADVIDTPPAGDGTGGTTGGGDMATAYNKVRFVGLDKDVLIPSDIEVIIDIVPDRFIGWVRSGVHFTGQTKTTFHDPGVPGQDAWSQRNYLHNGPSEGGARRQVGFNLASDDKRIIQLTPLNEHTWAAGTPEGNRTSWHTEACYGPNISWDRALRIAVALHAGLIEAMGWAVDVALVKHQHWFGKWCPAQILNRGLWPSVVAMVHRAVLEIKAFKAGVPSATISKGDICATTVQLHIRKEATTSSESLYLLNARDEVLIRDETPVTADGYTWWPVQSTTSKGEITGWAAEAGATGSYLVVVKDATPDMPPVMDYAKPLAIAELAPYVGRPLAPMPAAIMLEGGGVAVPVFDRFRTITPTPRRQQPSGDGRTGPDLPKGAEFDGSFTVIGDGDYAPYLITPWWTRVTLADLEVVSDSPKDIQPAEAA